MDGCPFSLKTVTQREKQKGVPHGALVFKVN